MIRFRFAAAFVALFCLSAGMALHAQMPTDNDTWKARCNALASVSDITHPTPQIVALTRGVAGSKFRTFGFDRDAAGQHKVACTLFFLGAVADQAGNGGKQDSSSAEDNATLARLQIKAMHGESPTFSERITVAKVKALEVTRPALTQADEENVMNAATTIPFTSLGVNTASLHVPAQR
jgi:hypothetical protein